MGQIPVLAPPIAFVVVLMAVLLFSAGLSRLAFRRKERPKGLTRPYASGEDLETHEIQPDYGQFFPFAFFFTILHVTALVVTTVPAARASTFFIAGVYVLGVVVGLTVLYRK
jgi:NADH:ubiquinone oxidoreductase subunit 3 (subunit A)